MECRVEFDYIAQEPDELTMVKGDVIKNVVPKMDGWYEGVLRGKTGVFPDNFVKIIEAPQPDPKASEVVVLRNNPSSVRRVRVLFSYSPEQEDELPLELGDVLEFIEEVEEGWWKGKLRGREGIFPSNFVEEFEEPKTNGGIEIQKPQEETRQKDTSRNSLSKGIPVPDVVPASPSTLPIEDEPAPELPPKPVRELARCFYPYAGLNEDELTLAEGDIVTIISKQCEDEGWWRGELRGKIGLFPDNFVKIISPGEVQTSVATTPGKMLAQERNLVSSSDFLGKSKKDSVTRNSTTEVDGGGLSKSAGDRSSLSESKIEQAKAKLNKTNSKESTQQLPLIAPKVGHAATSPISPGIAAFHNNLFSTQKPLDAFAKSKETTPTPQTRDEKVSDESEDFNSVERTETLNHLTATRAKAPKRRPPSTVITRENEVTMINGSSIPYDNSIPDSSPNHFNSTTPNHSVTSNGNMSGSYTDASLNHSGSFSRSDTKEGSPTPGGATTGNKPKKQALPWMAELKQTQDKKRNIASPVGPVSSNSTPSQSASSSPAPNAPSQTTNPSATTNHPHPTPGTRAPPLPAKPSSLSAASTVPVVTDKAPLSNNLNLSNTATPVVINSSSYGMSKNTFTVKKAPSPAPPTTINHNHVSTNSSTVDNGTHHRGDGENPISNSNKGYVSIEEYQALKTRVTCLENEVETLKRQIKLLMDRDLRGHIV